VRTLAAICDRGAAASGLDADAVRTSTDANIAAGAARLAELARARGISGTNLSSWAPVVSDFAQIPDDEARTGYVNDVMTVLASGGRRVTEDGRVVAQLDPHAEIGMPETSPILGAGGDYAGAVWRPSPNYSSRTSAVTLVVIHTCEGGYAGCWGWLRSSGRVRSSTA
jgi:hypothetical protein